jgi:hypothetical protein
MVALVVMLAAMLTMGARQDKPAEQSSVAAAARPGAVEMERLKFYLGEWDYAENVSEGWQEHGRVHEQAGAGWKFVD